MLLATTSNPDKHKNPQSLEVRLAEVGNELQQERYKRLQAERVLNKIEIEKRAPFVVPALFQASSTQRYVYMKASSDWGLKRGATMLEQLQNIRYYHQELDSCVHNQHIYFFPFPRLL